MRAALGQPQTSPSSSKAATKPPDVERGNILQTQAPQHEDTISTTQDHEKPDSTSANGLDISAKSGPELIANGSNQSRQLPQERFLWKRTHSYFALMGGFAVDVAGMSIIPIELGWGHATLSIPGLKLIAENDPAVLPYISEQKILDKSKANGFTKLVACLQASWFCAQVMGRLAVDGSPISLLELNTFLHAICCLGTYAAWWRKPLDIAEPELIDVSKEKNLGFYARLCLGRELYCRPIKLDTSDENTYRASLNRQDFQHSLRDYPVSQGTDERVHCFGEGDITDGVKRVFETHGHQTAIRIRHHQACYGYRLDILPDPGEYSERVYVELQWADIECLRRADDHIRVHTTPEENTETGWNSVKPLDMLVSHASMIDTPDETLLRWKAKVVDKTPKSVAEDAKEITDLKPNQVLWLGSVLAGAFYGGVHLLAWDGPFRSTTEQWMWRISCIIIASSLLVAALGFFIGFVFECMEKTAVWKKHENLLWKITAVILYSYLAGASVFFLVYTAARIYLVAECFINLAHLPPEVYNEPGWSRYIPHLSIG